MNISVVLHETGAINSNGDSIDKVCYWSQYLTSDQYNDIAIRKQSFFFQMAIDYVLVGGEQEFNGGFVNREDKKRHLMHISYDF